MPEITEQVSSDKPLPQRVCEVLAEEGYRPKLVTESDVPVHVLFKAEGRSHMVRFEDADDCFAQICAGVLLEGTSRDELAHLRAAQAVQATTKYVKVHVDEDLAFVEFQAEPILPDGRVTPEILNAAIGSIQAAWASYFQRVVPEKPQALA